MIINTLDGKKYETRVFASKPVVKATSVELDYDDVRKLLEMKNPTHLQFIMETIFMRLVPKGGDA